MTPEQIALVQSSFERLGPELPALATRFYQELFGRDPALRALFTTDLALQKIRFAEKLTEIVRAMPRLDELLAHTRALGARHAGYGVRAADYETVGDALLGALAAVLGDSFDAPACEAWAIAYNLVAETMLEGAASARPIGPLPHPHLVLPDELRVAGEGDVDLGCGGFAGAGRGQDGPARVMPS